MDKHIILVVDDNHINRLFFESSIRKMGFAVETAADGYTALQVCEVKSFDLILMDIRMMGMDGIQTATQIKQMTNHQHTTILAISAEPIDCEEAEIFTDCLLKPISQADLAASINQYLNVQPAFDHKQAMAVANHDEKIVNQLRTAFVEQLAEQWSQIEMHLINDYHLGLRHALHQLLGSAKMCGALAIVKAIETLNTGQSTTYERANFEPLKKAVTQVLSDKN